MSDTELLKLQLDNLKKLHVDLEKQMINFDEVLPYERQRTALIYSPRLLNIMLTCCPQIESVTTLIAQRCDISLEYVNKYGIKKSKSVRQLIREINSKLVLSKFVIVSKTNDLLFTPFGSDLGWWQKYNELKHELAIKQFEINYTVVMDALAGLCGLYCLADKLMSCFDRDIPEVLDSKNWVDSDYLIKIANLDKQSTINRYWESLLFGVTSFYKPY